MPRMPAHAAELPVLVKPVVELPVVVLLARRKPTERAHAVELRVPRLLTSVRPARLLRAAVTSAVSRPVVLPLAVVLPAVPRLKAPAFAAQMRAVQRRAA